jgi:hypothetical protein
MVHAHARTSLVFRANNDHARLFTGAVTTVVRARDDFMQRARGRRHDWINVL